MGAVHDNESIPVVFNALKHHLAFIRRFIEEADVTDLAFSLKPVGASQMDLYYGDLPQSSIFAQVIRKLEHDNLMERQKYNHWLTKTGGYATILLDDLSAWILRKSNVDIRFIHIHPARYSPNKGTCQCFKDSHRM